MNTIADSSGEDECVELEWLLGECPVCGHDDIKLRCFIPVQPPDAEPVYFAVCACCKNSTLDCKTPYEAAQKWDEKYDVDQL